MEKNCYLCVVSKIQPNNLEDMLPALVFPPLVDSLFHWKNTSVTGSF